MAKRLIITADDYGMNPAVNEGIEGCMAAGTVRSTCVMSNMSYCDDTGRLKARFPGVSVGLHWTLTSGAPVSAPSQVASLVDGDGQFLDAEVLRNQWKDKAIDPAQVVVELEAQYRRFCDLAGAPDYWNTHQNVHVWPGLFRLFTDCGKRLRIPAMRSHERHTQPKDGTTTGYHLRHPLYYLKGKLITRWSNGARSLGMRMPAGLIYMPGFREGRTAIEQVIDKLAWPTQPLELVIHPATRAEGEHFGALTESRLLEYRYFSQPEVVVRLAAAGVELASFASL